MQKVIVVGVSTVAALIVPTFSYCGVAAADDYAGQTYAKAAEAAKTAKQTLIIASRVGDKQSQDDCTVLRSQSAPFAGSDGAHVSDTVQLYLDCNGGYATANKPGPSQGSPEGRAAKAAADEKAAQEQAAAAQNSEDELAQVGQTPGQAGREGR